MKEILTNDGSLTLFNEEYQESYHSNTGAIEETIEKFIKPCKIEEIAKKGHIKILDICFGLGYNSLMAIEHALSSNPNCEIEIISLEKDLRLNEIKNLNTSFKYFNIIEKLEFDPITNSFLYEEKNIHLKIKIGEAQNTIKKIMGKFDAVFLDPFSPKKNPELWTNTIFMDIKKLMKKDAILATYSCARMVRDNFKEAGFVIFDGPKVGRRGPSTIAKLS